MLFSSPLLVELLTQGSHWRLQPEVFNHYFLHDLRPVLLFLLTNHDNFFFKILHAFALIEGRVVACNMPSQRHDGLTLFLYALLLLVQVVCNLIDIELQGLIFHLHYEQSTSIYSRQFNKSSWLNDIRFTLYICTVGFYFLRLSCSSH